MAPTWLKRVMRPANAIHVALYRLSRGRVVNHAAGVPLLLLTTNGRKSGKPRTNPVAFITDGQDYLIAATVGGMDWNPGWYYNLRNKPDAKIQVGNKTFTVRATVVAPEQRTHLYERFKAASGNFVKYERSVTRTIPVLRLTPTDTRDD
jgi:deazaflavin-dependent oxidoreductase (nitroreductase family)